MPPTQYRAARTCSACSSRIMAGGPSLETGLAHVGDAPGGHAHGRPPLSRLPAPRWRRWLAATRRMLWLASLRDASRTMPESKRLPLWLKLAYSAFMAVLIPVYWHDYGPTNFLYFCDVALILTLIGIWTESPLLVSMCAVGILAPQALWLIDLLSHLAGVSLTGM